MMLRATADVQLGIAELVSLLESHFQCGYAHAWQAQLMMHVLMGLWACTTGLFACTLQMFALTHL